MSPVTTDPGRGRGTGRPFTLIELVVAIAVIALTLGIAVSSLRGESAAQKLERKSCEFTAFCARVRFRAAEEGRDWVVRYDPGNEGFYAVAVPGDGEQGGAVLPGDASGRAGGGKRNGDDPDAPVLPVLRFKLGKEFVFETPEGAENQLADNEGLELFRFFPDGGASGTRAVVLKLGAMQKVFHVAKLTGRVIVSEELPE